MHETANPILTLYPDAGRLSEQRIARQEPSASASRLSRWPVEQFQRKKFACAQSHRKGLKHAMLDFIPERRINAFSFNALHRGKDVCRQGVILLDRLLRHRQKIVTDPGQDLLRIAIRGWSAEPVPLEDGAVHANDRVIELHLWNERLAAIGRFGPGLRWGARMRRRLLRSFALLAARLEADPALTGCVAIRVEIVLPDRRIAKLARLAGRFGFRQQGEATSPGLGRSLLALALAWTFNPGSLKAMRLKPARAIFWVSVPNFLARYRQVSIAVSRRPDLNAPQYAQALSRLGL